MPCLSAGPGWDWTTLSSLYPDVDVYTEQLRALEEYVTANPNSAAARFLLAYHYMICGHTDAAANSTEGGDANSIRRIGLSAQLLAMLTPSKRRRPRPPPPAGPAAPAKPVDGRRPGRRLEGQSPRRRRPSRLSLTKDGKYTWKFDQQGKPQEFSGPYAVADRLLILKKGDTPVMIGQVSSLANGVQFQAARRQPQRSGLDVRQVSTHGCGGS